MLRTIPISERNVTIDAPNIINVPAATATVVLLDERTTRNEISQRFIQNTGANDLYYSEGVADNAGGGQCNNTNVYHGMVLAGQQLDCSAHRRMVTVYSVGGTTVATTIRRRVDMGHHN